MEIRDIPFTDSAQRVLARAHEEAALLRHPCVATEHLLLGLTGETTGVAAAVLRRCGVEADRARATIEAMVPGGNGPTASLPRPYSSKAGQSLALALQSARDLGGAEVGAEHLLIGLLREGRGVGGQLLMQYGVSERTVLEEISRPSDENRSAKG